MASGPTIIYIKWFVGKRVSIPAKSVNIIYVLLLYLELSSDLSLSSIIGSDEKF